LSFVIVGLADRGWQADGRATWSQVPRGGAVSVGLTVGCPECILDDDTLFMFICQEDQKIQFAGGQISANSKLSVGGWCVLLVVPPHSSSSSLSSSISIVVVGSSSYI
jgi:hypothetical protein